MKKKSELTEDVYAECEEEMQKLTDQRCKEIDKLTEEKEKELIDKINTDKGKNNGINPAHYLTYSGVFAIFPPVPGYEACGVVVDNEWNDYYAQPALYP